MTKKVKQARYWNGRRPSSSRTAPSVCERLFRLLCTRVSEKATSALKTTRACMHSLCVARLTDQSSPEELISHWETALPWQLIAVSCILCLNIAALSMSKEWQLAHWTSPSMSTRDTTTMFGTIHSLTKLPNASIQLPERSRYRPAQVAVVKWLAISRGAINIPPFISDTEKRADIRRAPQPGHAVKENMLLNIYRTTCLSLCVYTYRLNAQIETEFSRNPCPST